MLGVNFLLFIIAFNEITLYKLDSPPVIDGVLEKTWYNAVLIEDFVQYEPVEGGKCEYKTQIFIGYESDALYVAFKCYDDVKTLRKSLRKRDNIPEDEDLVLIFLNTYGKGEEGYIFGTNPMGVQLDGISGRGYEDYKFDTYFEVKSSISDSFWTCEFKIPFSSLRFEKKEKQEWKCIFMRKRPRETFTIYSFPSISKSISSFFGQGAKIIISERIYSKGKMNELIPYVIGSQNGVREKKYNNDRGKFDLGVSGRRNYQNLVLDYALNPDFAQIETDIPQIDVNTTYALYYPEKRPLFMEGSEYIKMPTELFYTRMVNNPFYALKFTGKISLFDLYFLSSYDENTPYILPFEDASFNFGTTKKSFINLLRIRSRVINDASHIGFFIGSREFKKDEFDNGFGRIFGFDTRIKFLNHYEIEYQGGYSHNKESEDTSLFSGIGIKFKNHTDKFDGEKFNGFLNYLSFNSSFRNLYFSLSYNEMSEGFRSDIGFIDRNNFKNWRIYIKPIFYPNKFGIAQIYFWTRYKRESNFKGVFKYEEIKGAFRVNFSFAQLILNGEFSREDKNVFNIYYLNYSRFKNIYFSSFFLYGAPFQFFSFYISYGEGKKIFYQMDTLVFTTSLTNYITLKFTNLTSDFGLDKVVYYFKRHKEKITEANVFYLTLNYNFTDKISLKTILTYYKGETGIYPLFVYQVNPFTVFYLGANINAIRCPYKIKGEKHQIFLKFQYLFKI